MTITSVTKGVGEGYLVIIKDGVEYRRSIVLADSVVSVPVAGYEEVGNIYINQATGELILEYNGNTLTLGDQTGAEIVTLLEALAAGSRLSHTKLDDVGASDHHTKYTDAEALAASLPLIIALGG